MTCRTAAIGTVVLAAACLFPATAQAAPIAPSRAILTPSEFPSGSSGYRLIRTTAPSIPKASGLTDNPCELAAMRLRLAAADARSAEAVAHRGKTYTSVELTDRDLVQKTREVIEACRPNGGDTLAVVSTPAEFTRYRVYVGTTGSGGKEIQGWAAVRGVTVQVIIDSAPGGPDFETFWQLLRTQIAKVERQP